MSTSLEIPRGVVETIHGVPVADPYRWLEERESPATEAWLQEQRLRFESYFDGLGDLDQLRSRVRTLLDVETIGQIGRVRDQYFYRRRRPGEEQASIYAMDAVSGQERVLVDAQLYDRFTSVSIHRVSENASFLAFELKHGGEHTKEIYVVDVRSGATLPDHLERGRACGFAFSNNDTGFYYCHEFADQELSPPTGHQVRFHRFGDPRDSDRVLLELPRAEESKVVLIYDGDSLGAIHCRGLDGESFTDFHISSQQDDTSWTCIRNEQRERFSPFFHAGRLFAHDRSRSVNGEIVELDPATGLVKRVVVPEWITRTRTCAFAGGRLLVSYIVGTDIVIHAHSLEGGDYEVLRFENGFLWAIVPGFTNYANELFLVRESLNAPPNLFRYDPRTKALVTWHPADEHALLKSISMRTVQYASKDGTEIEMSIFGPSEDTDWRNRPTITTAYGGFGVTLLPAYSPFVAALLERGFLCAIPRIRGGGEYGEEWHRSAQRRQRQTAYDDFLAAAQWLCDEGHTAPRKLAVFGGSNSALLVGAAITQRPDLFGAALCIAPILDMVRYHRFDRAYVWSKEYGTADDAEDFHALYAYSPYHRVEEGVDYPAVLFVTGDQDTRCNPAHARKMAAALLHRSDQTRPILIDHTPERGHAPVLPLEVRVEAMARRIAFLCHELGVPVQGGGRDDASRL